MKTLATFETPSWNFQAIGNSKDHCRTLLYQAWNIHCKQTGADPKYILEFDNDIFFIELGDGFVYRDGELFLQGD